MFTYHRAHTDDELHQILQVQSENLKDQVDENKRLSDGFVTLKHDFYLLKRMNDACPHIIAKDEDRVVGFALSMLGDFKDDIPLLDGMFKMADRLFPDRKYLVMGQVCVDENYRGKGVFRGLYTHMQSCYKNGYDPLVTIVAKQNIRSLNAHKAIGFQAVQSNNEVDWVFIVWKWNTNDRS
ncbi:GNAT family N-acetyltransferase [Spongiivirga citrea]|uniref:GNAT family N-acetyltransferase n=1 Tax=Spongiivirga citrea TaxID=1481457 RepID=A0A6M0CTI5_9FLAO|nr:GNAT family N-acetyltransferase [Spongiivirga citrea]NER17110.1 GNAT family N-acetyltransferase [Spongiivirga citrea]